MSAAVARLPEPFVRHLHPVEIAEFTAGGQHCDVRGCHKPVTIYGWYYRLRSGHQLAYERHLCGPHGEAFARRQHADIEPAPAESELRYPHLPPRVTGPGAYLAGMSAGQLAEHDELGWHCDFPRCRERARYLSSLRYLTGSGQTRRRARFVCDGHAARFAARHGINFTAVLPPERSSRRREATEGG